MQPTRSRAVALFVGLGLLTSGLSGAQAQGPSIQVAATCIGLDAYRIDVRVFPPAWLGSVPDPGGEVLVNVRLFALQGAFGMASAVQNDADHELLEAETGSLVWLAPWLAPALVARFECEQGPGRLELDFDCILEYFHHYELGWDHWDLLGADRVGGHMTAEVTGEVGSTSILRENPIAVSETSWSGVKALYR